jgi:hypothetical protein
VIRRLSTSMVCTIYDPHAGDYENRAGFRGLLDAAISEEYNLAGFDAV